MMATQAGAAGAVSGSGFLSRLARAETDGDAHEHPGGVMASARTTYQGGQGGDGTAPPGDTFVWVSLRDPSSEELASVQREFGLPGPLVDELGTAAKRPVLEVFRELLFAVVKTARWAAAAEAVTLGEVQLVLGEGFVVSVDRNAAILEGVRQDPKADPELAGAGPAAVLFCIVKHAVEGYGRVLSALNDDVEDLEESVFDTAGSRPTERIYRLARQVLGFRRAMVPLTEMFDRLATESPTPPASRSAAASTDSAPTCGTWSGAPTASATCSPTPSRPTRPRCRCARTTTCAGSRPGLPSGPSRP
jgi:Mg2+ and Co2+ transporter CorA